MGIDRFKREKTPMCICTIGGDRHGKTALAAAISKTMSLQFGTDPVSYEEIRTGTHCQAEGLEFTASAITYETSSRRYTHIDFPTSLDFCKAVLAKAYEIQGVLLVVSAADEVADLRKDIALCNNAGIPVYQPAVFVNKTDLTEDDDFYELEEEISALLMDCGLPGDETAYFYGSALAVLNAPEDSTDPAYEPIIDLVDFMDNCLFPPENVTDLPFLMRVEETYFITGRGVVAIGPVERGVLLLNDEARLVGMSEDSKKTVVTGIEQYRKLLDEAVAGQQVGLLLRGVAKGEVIPGQVITKDRKITAQSAFCGLVCLSGTSCPAAVEVGIGGVRFAGRVTRTEPWDEDCVELYFQLDVPVVLERGQHISIYADNTPIGCGIVTAI